MLVLNSPATGTIKNNEGGEPTVSVADAEATEGPGATLDFMVTLDRALDETVTVDYATADGTATAGADYTTTSGTLTFEPGEQRKTIAVPIAQDAVEDDGETLTLTLSDVSGAELADGGGDRHDPEQRAADRRAHHHRHAAGG